MRAKTILARLPAIASIAALSFILCISGTTMAKAQTNDLDNTVYLELKDGRVVIKLLPDLAPKHVERVKTLVKQHFYDGLSFFRVIDGFMAQGGDPNNNGTGGSSLPDLPAEFTTAKKFERGTVGAARTSNPNSANSQFYIMFAPAPNLDGQYTIWGQVVSGMDAVDKIKKGDGPNGRVSDPDKIISMRLASDTSK
jgi:peptidylprolyl isomerase